MPHSMGCDSRDTSQAHSQALAEFGVSGTLVGRIGQGDRSEKKYHRGNAGRHHRSLGQAARRMDAGTVGRNCTEAGTRNVWHASTILLAKRCAGWQLREDPAIAPASGTRPRPLATPGRIRPCLEKCPATSQTSSNHQTAGKRSGVRTLAGTTACGLGTASCTSGSIRSAEAASRSEEQQWPAWSITSSRCACVPTCGSIRKTSNRCAEAATQSKRQPRQETPEKIDISRNQKLFVQVISGTSVKIGGMVRVQHLPERTSANQASFSAEIRQLFNYTG